MLPLQNVTIIFPKKSRAFKLIATRVWLRGFFKTYNLRVIELDA